MKKLLPLLSIILLPLFNFANGFVISGHVEGLQVGKISLAYINERGEDTTITASITQGAFTLAGKVEEPESARLTITEGWAYNTSLFLENSAISISLVNNDIDKTVIKGSASNIVFEGLQPGLNKFFEHARTNDMAHHQALSPKAIQSADSLWNNQQSQWIKAIRSAVASNADNYAALYFIQWLLFKPQNYDTILSAFMQLSPAVRNGKAGKKFSADLEHWHKISPGQKAPEVTGRDTLGHAVTLAAYKGKVILLDFWSSYCGPCRQENRRMLPVYQKYHAAGFEMVSVSLDNERSLWLQAIRTDGMPWPQTSDLRGGAGATAGVYDISDLPRNVLIDKTGKIYAKDLHGDDLVKAMEVLLAK